MVRPKLCPGCKVPKADHFFGPPGPHCAGLSDGEEEGVKKADGDNLTKQLLAAVRNLSSQVNDLRLDQEDIKGKLSREKPPAPGNDKPVQPLSSSEELIGIPKYLPKKFANALKGEYVDFGELLTALNLSHAPNPDGLSLASDGSGKLEVIRSQQRRSIDSFDTWLQVWNVYELELVTGSPERYGELARYRAQIHEASRRFRWSCVYVYDVKTRLSVASRRDVNARFDEIDTTLYATTLDASALRVGGKQCHRCKSYDHEVKDCTFLASDALEKNKEKPHGKTAQSHGNNAWKFDKWFDNNGKEGCNLYQRKACSAGANCKRAHICKACRGDHPQADCKHCA